jgi:signal transduction histidine kinase
MDEVLKRKASSILRFRFSNLTVRQKLMLLHNLFFLVLSGLVYLAATARWHLGLVLAVIYLAAVAVLELLILPRYVYGPIKRLLDADRASRLEDHDHEYIEETLIPGDELGRIMRSRNETVRKLRRHEAELVRKNEMLERQDRLASLGLLSASVAHELNTPLAVLRGSIEKLQETLNDPHAQERLSRMLRVTERLRSISEGLIGFARARKDETGPVGVRKSVEEAWALVAIDEKAAEVHFHNHAGESLRVNGNSGRLVQVFVNLLRNAMAEVPAGGNIVVDARAERQDGRAVIAITVDDDGPGIPPDVLPNIFEAFVTTRLDARGTGLGLTVAEGIVIQHGGTIEASNRPAGGARLEVRLPALE